MATLPIRLLVKLGLLMLFIFSPIHAGAEEKTLSASQNADVCRYVYDSQIEGIHSGLNPLWGNIKDIYVYSEKNISTRDSVNSLKPNSIAELARCTIRKNTKDRVPVHAPQIDNAKSVESLDKWPIFSSSDNLVIYIDAQAQDNSKFYHKPNSDKLVSIAIRFYRPNIGELDFRNAICTGAFNQSTDDDQTLLVLTDVLHRCLDKPFFNLSR